VKKSRKVRCEKSARALQGQRRYKKGRSCKVRGEDIGRALAPIHAKREERVCKQIHQGEKCKGSYPAPSPPPASPPSAAAAAG
jgi:hypothetical protein